MIGRHRGNGDGDFLLSAPGSWLAAPRPVFKGTHVQSPISAATVSTDEFLGLLVFSCSAVAVAIFFFALSVPEIGHK